MDMGIYRLLYRLGMTSNYIGFEQIAYAVHLAVQEPECLECVTKLLYPEVAAHFHTNAQAVERNIRTVANAAWKKARHQLEALAKHPLMKKPTASQLIAMLASVDFSDVSFSSDLEIITPVDDLT